MKQKRAIASGLLAAVLALGIWSCTKTRDHSNLLDPSAAPTAVPGPTATPGPNAPGCSGATGSFVFYGSGGNPNTYLNNGFIVLNNTSCALMFAIDCPVMRYQNPSGCAGGAFSMVPPNNYGTYYTTAGNHTVTVSGCGLLVQGM